jgi:hypothetical protein
MDNMQQVEALLRRLTIGGRLLRPGGLIERLSAQTGLPRLDVRDALAILVREEKLSGVSRAGEPLKMVMWIGEPKSHLSPAAEQLQIVLESIVDPSLKTTLAPLLDCADLFEGLSSDDIEGVVRGLLQCKTVTDRYRDPVFVSAANILGSAKALKNLRRPARALGLDCAGDPGGELYVLTAGPAHPTAIVLIENIRSFTAFARSVHAQKAIGVAAYGYGLTMENFGARLAAGHVIACPAYGTAVDLQAALDRLPALFWGDLDREGLRIYESLRQQLPSIALSAAYTAMEERLRNKTLCHPYHKLFEKDGQRPPRGATPETAHLTNMCLQRAVDQEALGYELSDVDVLAPYHLPPASARR